MPRRKSSKLEGLFYILFGIAAVFAYIIQQIFEILAAIAPLLYIGVAAFILYKLYVFYYFRSKDFNKLKESILAHTQNCNDLNNYIEALKLSYLGIQVNQQFKAELTDNSRYKYKRKEWESLSSTKHTLDCSAAICKNASIQPIKYICKYFQIEANESSLEKYEKVLNDFSSVELGKEMIEKEKNNILEDVSNKIPYVIWRFNRAELTEKLGFHYVDLSENYIPAFTFQYISSGGNSSMRCEVKLTIKILNELIRYLNDKITWSKSVAGQRALMTSALRDFIKSRDNYECQTCGIGLAQEPHLLLEIDHIIPVSKGGITSTENLQTLCWKCNRSKGAKMF
jgi:hypothetical protein